MRMMFIEYMISRMEKAMKDKKKLIYISIEIVYSIIMLLFLNYMLKNYSFGTAYQTPLENCLRVMLIILILFFGAFWNKIIVFLYQLIISAYLISQSIYQVSFESYWRIKYALSLRNEVAGVKSSVAEFLSLEQFIPIIVLFVITILFIVLFFVFERKAFKFIYLLPVKLASLLLIILVVNNHNSFLSMLDESKHSIDSFQKNKTDYYIYDTIPTANEFVNKFGLVSFAYRDINGYYAVDSNSEEAKLVIADFMNKKSGHNSNDMTGIFEGKNVIFIQAESFVDAAIDPDLTPNIYKYKNEGINFSSFNTPLLPGSTSDTEFMANTSIIPYSADGGTCYTYPFNTYKTTLATMFNNLGYKTEALHNCYGEYYNRDVVFPNLGYDLFLDCTAIGFEDCASDLDTGRHLSWLYAEKNYNWMLYWITYSGHQPYNRESVGVNQENLDRIFAKYPEMEEAIACYMSKNMDLDQALGEMMYALECYGKLGEVVFVFYGDHFCKGISFEGNGNQTDLFIYNSEIEHIECDKESTVLDLVPTIANMWNIDIDNKTILGSDIFDPDYHGFRFDDWGTIETDDFSYNGLEHNQEIKTNITEKEMLDSVGYYQSLQDISRNIIKYNYFED